MSSQLCSTQWDEISTGSMVQHPCMMYILLTGHKGKKNIQGVSNRKPGVSMLGAWGCGGFRKKINTPIIFNITVKTLTLHLTLMSGKKQNESLEGRFPELRSLQTQQKCHTSRRFYTIFHS